MVDSGLNSLSFFITWSFKAKVNFLNETVVVDGNLSHFSIHFVQFQYNNLWFGNIDDHSSGTIVRNKSDCRQTF